MLLKCSEEKMQLTIDKTKENLFLHRREISGKIIFEGATPSNKEVMESLAKKLSVEVAAIALKNIYNLFSRQEATFEAMVYKDIKGKEAVEKKTPQEKKKIKEAAKAAAKKEVEQ